MRVVVYSTLTDINKSEGPFPNKSTLNSNQTENAIKPYKFTSECYKLWNIFMSFYYLPF